MYNSLVEAEEAAKVCNKCALCQNRKKPIFASGNENAKVMFVFDWPHEDEESEGDLWQGNAGKFISQALIGLGIDKEKIYLTSLLKCKVGERDLQNPEINTCLDYLRSQVVIVKPKIVVLFGNVVIREILGDENTVSTIRGNVVERKGIKYIPTYNALALFKDESKKIDLWNDLKLLKEEAIKENIEL